MSAIMLELTALFIIIINYHFHVRIYLLEKEFNK
jgi:hypothetical protein